MMFRYIFINYCRVVGNLQLLIQEYSSAELRSFKMHYTDLLMNIHNLAELSERLFAADLLSFYMIQAICSLKKPVQRLVKLLDTVEIQISLDPLKFDTFVKELRKDRPMQHLCDKLRSTCGECDNVCLSTLTDQWCSGVAQLMEDEVIPAILPTRTPSEQRMSVYGALNACN